MPHLLKLPPPPHSYIILPTLAAQLLYNFTPLNKLPLHSYTILSPLAAQLLHHYTPSEQINPPLLQHFTHLGSPTFTSFYPLLTKYPLNLTPFYPPWQPNSYIIKPPLDILPPYCYTILPPLAAQILAHVTPSGQINPSLLQFTPLGSPTLTSFYPLWINYPLTLTPIYPPWQPNSYIILPPLNKLPPTFTSILPPLAAQLLHHFTLSGQITPSLLHHFTPLGRPTVTSLNPF